MNPLKSRPVLYACVLAAVLVGGARVYIGNRLVQSPVFASPPPPAPDEAIDTFISSNEAALLAGDFDRLEKEARTDRDVEVRFAGGYSKLRYFYRGLGSFGTYDNCGCGKVMYYTHLTFGQKLHALRQWLSARPGSMAATIAIAALWDSVAWNARGHDYADETPADSMDLFRKRLSVEAAYLRRLDPAADPAIYDMQLSLFRGTADGKAAILPVYTKAVQAFPTYYVYYSGMAGLLEPRWFGDPGDLQHYGGTLTSSDAGETGLIAYSYVAESLLSDFSKDEVIGQTGLDWVSLKRSFAVRARRYGSSPKLLNAELKLAAAAGDQPFAAQLVKQIGTRWDPNVWRDWADFVVAASWAGRG